MSSALHKEGIAWGRSRMTTTQCEHNTRWSTENQGRDKPVLLMILIMFAFMTLIMLAQMILIMFALTILIMLSEIILMFFSSGFDNVCSNDFKVF